MTDPVVVDDRFCGIAGRGQGGYLGGLVAGHSSDAVQIDFRNAIPLATPLTIVERRQVLQLVDGDRVIVERRSGSSPTRMPDAVDPRDAHAARSLAETNMPEFVGSCFSCGTRPDSLRVHAGPTGDGRFATPFVPPAWTAPDGVVEPPFVWAPLDCASGWALSWEPPHAMAVTATLTIQTHRRVLPGVEYTVVADTEPEWRGRRRHAWSAMYSAAGDLVAASESLWVKLRTG